MAFLAAAASWRRPRHGGRQPGRALKPADVKTYGNEAALRPAVLRTIFLQFESEDWEQELAAFNNTDVDVPAVATVDGRTYRNVGVHFRGMSSYFMVPAGSKRSLNLSFDFVDEKQRLLGYRTLNLLNVNSDPTFVTGDALLDIARSTFRRRRPTSCSVVINGESWGVYINAQQYNKDSSARLQDRAGRTLEGAGQPRRPRRPGTRATTSPTTSGPTRSRRRTTRKVWASLIHMFKVLNETPPDKLEALAPMLDIDGALRFLAVDNALVNTDGYWTRASDYSIYQDAKGRFHVIPHDMNEALINEAAGRPRSGRSAARFRPWRPRRTPPGPAAPADRLPVPTRRDAAGDGPVGGRDSAREAAVRPSIR